MHFLLKLVTHCSLDCSLYLDASSKYYHVTSTALALRELTASSFRVVLLTSVTAEETTTETKNRACTTQLQLFLLFSFLFSSQHSFWPDLRKLLQPLRFLISSLARRVFEPSLARPFAMIVPSYAPRSPKLR